jgi:hypothetical protein
MWVLIFLSWDLNFKESFKGIEKVFKQCSIGILESDLVEHEAHCSFMAISQKLSNSWFFRGP